jgi:quinol-cytochrome oxidoreductase complex cytochrome b subunit
MRVILGIVGVVLGGLVMVVAVTGQREVHWAFLLGMLLVAGGILLGVTGSRPPAQPSPPAHH